MKNIFITVAFLLCIATTMYGQNKIDVLEIIGNQLNFKLESDADSVFLHTPIFGFEKLNKKGGAYQKSYTLDSINYCLFSYAILEYRKGLQKLLVRNVYHGDYFQKSPERVEKIKGTINLHYIKSKILEENRVISVYKPPKYDKKKTYGVVYFMDGENMSSYAPFVEKLILDNKICDIILVGVHNRSDTINDGLSMKNGKIDYRALEYLENYAAYNDNGNSKHHVHHNQASEIPEALKNRHNDFINFLKIEVIDWVNSNYKVSESYYKRAIFGRSDGGSFVVALSRKEPNLFGSNIAFSFAWSENTKRPNWKRKMKPKFYLAAGEYEPSYLNEVKKWEKILEKEGSEFVFTINKSGHDSEMWHIEFIKSIEKIFAK